MGLVGSVRNRPDGSVVIHAAGSEHALERLEALLEEGPPAARVEQVQRLTFDGGMPRDGFRVLY
jgi:acylphosphatase